MDTSDDNEWVSAPSAQWQQKRKNYVNKCNVIEKTLKLGKLLVTAIKIAGDQSIRLAICGHGRKQEKGYRVCCFVTLTE